VLPAHSSLTDPAKWHVTLVFLGDAPTDRVVEALSSIQPPGPATADQPPEPSATSRPPGPATADRPPELSSSTRPPEQSSSDWPPEPSPSTRPPEPSSSARLLRHPRPLGPFPLRLAGSGSFGAAAWVGVSGDLPALTDLRERVRARSAPLVNDPRPYRPHLTVSYRADAAIRAAISGYSGDEWLVEDFTLASSQGGQYEKLRTWPL